MDLPRPCPPSHPSPSTLWRARDCSAALAPAAPAWRLDARLHRGYAGRAWNGVYRARRPRLGPGLRPDPQRPDPHRPPTRRAVPTAPACTGGCRVLRRYASERPSRVDVARTGRRMYRRRRMSRRMSARRARARAARAALSSRRAAAACVRDVGWIQRSTK
jgi:hypothetical protein